ncbi:MAG: hypothetical protein KH921_07150 [Erysipelotrichaceae bacterium]|nr:hypothetical protein [Erysipelotrichaceae bacterium]
MSINQYDKVLLKDGRTATIVEVLEADKAYIADIDLPDSDWETTQIGQEDIEKVL